MKVYFDNKGILHLEAENEQEKESLIKWCKKNDEGILSEAMRVHIGEEDEPGESE